MFEVINEEKSLGIPRGRPHLIGEWQCAQLRHAERTSEDRGNQPMISHRRERNEAHSVGIIGGNGRRYCQSKASLADATRTRQGKETYIFTPKQRADLLDLAFPPDEARQRRWN